MNRVGVESVVETDPGVEAPEIVDVGEASG